VAIPEDISVPLVGVIAFALILWKNRLAARPNNLATLTRLRPAHGDTHERGSGAGCAGRFPPWRHPVALTKTGICDFGWKARDFSLEGVDGKSYTLPDARGPKGTVVVFICNHCPYVKASIERIADEARALQALGIGTIAVMPNDVEEYPQDSLPNMQAFARKHSLPFPYAIDETQDVARAYGAQCTPDFFGFNVNDELQYRGRLDAGRIQPVPGARRDLYEAMKQVAETGRGPEEQLPSMGCSIKWKD